MSRPRQRPCRETRPCIVRPLIVMTLPPPPEATVAVTALGAGGWAEAVLAIPPRSSAAAAMAMRFALRIIDS